MPHSGTLWDCGVMDEDKGHRPTDDLFHKGKITCVGVPKKEWRDLFFLIKVTANESDFYNPSKVLLPIRNGLMQDAPNCSTE